MASAYNSGDGVLIINPQQLTEDARRELSNCNESVFIPMERTQPKSLTKSRSVPNFFKKFLSKRESSMPHIPDISDQAATVTYVTPTGDMSEIMEKLHAQTTTVAKQGKTPLIEKNTKKVKKKTRKKLNQSRNRKDSAILGTTLGIKLNEDSLHPPQDNLSDVTDVSDDRSSNRFSDISESEDNLSLLVDGTGHVNTLFQFDEEFQSNKSIITESVKFGKKGKGPGEIEDATDITYLGKGRILVTDLVNNRLQIFDKNGRGNITYALNEVVEPWATTLTPDGYIAVTSKKEQCIVVLSRDGNVVMSFGHDTCICPSGIAVNKHNNYLVTDLVSKNVILYDVNGNFISKIESNEGFLQPRYVCVSHQGEIIVSDTGDHCVKVFNEDGVQLRTIGRFGRRDAQFKSPHGVCTDRLGNIFVADHYNDRISVFTRDGQFVRHLVTPNNGLMHPQALALSKDNKLYVSHGNLKAHEIITFLLKKPTDEVADTTAEVYDV